MATFIARAQHWTNLVLQAGPVKSCFLSEVTKKWEQNWKWHRSETGFGLSGLQRIDLWLALFEIGFIIADLFFSFTNFASVFKTAEPLLRGQRASGGIESAIKIIACQYWLAAKRSTKNKGLFNCQIAYACAQFRTLDTELFKKTRLLMICDHE